MAGIDNPKDAYFHIFPKAGEQNKVSDASFQEAEIGGVTKTHATASKESRYRNINTSTFLSGVEPFFKLIMMTLKRVFPGFWQGFTPSEFSAKVNEILHGMLNGEFW